MNKHVSGFRSPGILFQLRTRLRSAAITRAWYRRKRKRMADYYVISFPKAGRTWLRLMMGHALAGHFEIESEDLVELHHLAEHCLGIPLIRAKHDDDPHLKTPRELVQIKNEFTNCKIILLVRDLRDLVVSMYFEATRREKSYSGDIHQFVYEERGSARTAVEFYNIWARNRHVPEDLLLVRYEDMKADPARELQRVLTFCGVCATADVV